MAAGSEGVSYGKGCRDALGWFGRFGSCFDVGRICLGVHRGGRQAGGAEGVAGPVEAPVAGSSGEPKTPLIRSLLHVLKSRDGNDSQAEAQVERSLREADEKLQDVLHENSKRLILEANRKPLVPRIDLNFGPASGSRPSITKSGSNEPRPR